MAQAVTNCYKSISMIHGTSIGSQLMDESEVDVQCRLKSSLILPKECALWLPSR